MGSMKTYRVLLSGRVQGVGCRYFVEEKANLYGIKGYVRNTWDNNVEVVCQGSEKMLDIFIPKIKKGPAFARVDNVSIEEIQDSQEYSSFQISY